MIDIKSLNLDQLDEELKAFSLPRFRTKQIFKWLQNEGVDSFHQMTNLPKNLREQLSENFEIRHCEIEKKYCSEIDETVKYVFKLNDNELIESVVMKYKYGYTICVSSQVGCKMGCKFCASTLSGFQRNLTASEILSQIHRAQLDLNVRISHIVLMGMGEPLDNFENVIKFVELVNCEDGMCISMRNISLSTCGVVPSIYKLMEKKIPLTLSISLHAPNDEIRSRTMPVNDVWGIDQLLKACRDYISVTGRRISFEYTLIDGVNDSERCANELSTRLRGMLCHVNLIPVNKVEESGFSKSSNKNITKFAMFLKNKGINATIRRTLGSDINASCGQLRRREMQKG